MFTEQEKSNYRPDAFDHYNIEPNNENKIELQRASMILETGFNLYFIYAIMMEVKIE